MPGERLADETAQGLAGVIAPQAVQVELALDAPVATAQLARHIGADAGPAKAQQFVGIEQGAHVKLVTDGLVQDRLFVVLVAHYHRRRPLLFQ